MLNQSLAAQLPDRQHRPITNSSPVDARACLLDLSFLAREVATSSDPRVISGGLEVLAMQANFLASAARGAK